MVPPFSPQRCTEFRSELKRMKPRFLLWDYCQTKCKLDVMVFRPGWHILVAGFQNVGRFHLKRLLLRFCCYFVRKGFASVLRMPHHWPRGPTPFVLSPDDFHASRVLLQHGSVKSPVAIMHDIMFPDITGGLFPGQPAPSLITTSFESSEPKPQNVLD